MVINQLVIPEMVVVGWNSNKCSNVSEIDVSPDAIKGDTVKWASVDSSSVKWSSVDFFLINWSTEASPVDN
ncbi:MAG TPA: hypothetical protein VIP09_11120 [Dehalococcoidia bacterium]